MAVGIPRHKKMCIRLIRLWCFREAAVGAHTAPPTGRSRSRRRPWWPTLLADRLAGAAAPKAVCRPASRGCGADRRRLAAANSDMADQHVPSEEAGWSARIDPVTDAHRGPFLAESAPRFDDDDRLRISPVCLRGAQAYSYLPLPITARCPHCFRPFRGVVLQISTIPVSATAAILNLPR